MTKIFIPRDMLAVALGADEVAAAIADQAAKKNISVQIIRNSSRGMAWLEPFVEIETPEGRIGYGGVKVADVAGLFEANFLNGGAHALAQGLVEEIPYLKKQERVMFARAGITDPVSIEDYIAHGGYEGLKKALALGSADIVKEVLDSGLRGRGGAGFPTGLKWKTVSEAKAEQKYVCCNADEGDSGTFADRMVMEGDPFMLIEGMTIAGLAAGSTKGFIYCRSEYPYAISTLKEAIAIATKAGWLGENIQSTDKSFVLEVRRGAGAYICGEETAMLESLEGKRGMVRAKPPIPALEGLFGQPTIINNVLSFAAVPYIMAKGAKTYADMGMGRSRGTMPFQLGGNLERGGIVEKAFGVTLRELVEDFGGGPYMGKPLRAVQLGGPLGAYVSAEQLDLKMDYETLAANGAMLGHGGIVVFDTSVDMAQQARFAMEFCAIESCGKCTPCRIGSTRGVEVIDKIIAGENREYNAVLLEDLCTTMTDGSLCAMGGLTPMPVMSAFTKFPEDFGLPKPKRLAAE
ncbi:formate dehydrogenase beta subunit [Aestuariivirga litoralis]|uniref:formate dehydrogenase beta subunit n=1 Tax=Aestuariivirga litoralis TaxID=2650924 RepID=UPI0018C53949|nr:formate dehydrogenase beta subunit [Aestuariivirga litoralis]MBG1232242.1 formate dehydrogenase [Aestuariivirga litoralis]